MRKLDGIFWIHVGDGIANIRNERMMRGYTQSQLARKAGRCASWLCARENGTSPATAEDIARLRAALDQLDEAIST